MEAPEIVATQSRGFTRESIEHNSAPVQKVDHHDHGNKTTATIALILASCALGAILMAVPLVLLLMDSKIEAGVATAEATAQAGKEHARIALAEVQRANAQLEAKGLISSSQH